MTLASQPGPCDTAAKHTGTSIQTFLTRLIWLSVGPLVLVAAYLAIDRVRSVADERDRQAANLASGLATAIDQDLTARIGALHMLAESPLVDDASRRAELYREAQAFRQSFGSHVVLADLDRHMLFNTRVPLGTPLPMLPQPAGRAAAPTAVRSGKPAVGDVFQGPLALEPLVAVAVPALRDGKAAFVLLTTFEARRFQSYFDSAALPAGWSLSLRDSTGALIARRAPPGLDAVGQVDPSGRFVAPSTVSRWSVVLEIPRDIYRAPLVVAATTLAITVLGATLAGVLGGLLAGRRLARAVASLAETPAAGAAPSAITEIAAVRRLLDAAAEAVRRAMFYESRDALVAANRRLALAADAAQVGVWELDTCSGALTWDARMFEIFRASPVESSHTYATWRQAVLPEDLPGIESQLNAAILNGTDLDGVFRINWPSGEMRVVRARALMVAGDAGRTARVVGVNWDITEAQGAEARMKELLALQTAILGSAAVSIIATDPAGTILSFNRAAQQMLGYSVGEMIGCQTPAILHDPAEVTARAGALSRELGRLVEPGFEVFAAKAREGKADLQEWAYIRKDGSRFPVLLSMTGTFDADGSLIGFLGIASDITDQKARERTIADSLAEKGVLLQEIHHRVKNNLQVVSSLLQLQAGYLEDGAARRVFEESQGRIKSMALVHEKLYQSKDLAHLDFGGYLRDLVAGLADSHGACAAPVVIEVRAAALHLDVDRAIPCGLIVNEWVSNAFKHGFPNGRAGRIEVTLSGGGGSAIQLTVRDDGVGWPADFDPARSPSLGLQLVHILAKQLRGGLQLQSDKGISCSLTLDAGHPQVRETTAVSVASRPRSRSTI